MPINGEIPAGAHSRGRSLVSFSSKWSNWGDVPAQAKKILCLMAYSRKEELTLVELALLMWPGIPPHKNLGHMRELMSRMVGWGAVSFYTVDSEILYSIKEKIKGMVPPEEPAPDKVWKYRAFLGGTENILVPLLEKTPKDSPGE